MRSSLTWTSGRRGWLTLGTLSTALVAGLLTQIVPSAAAEAPRGPAQTVQAPTVVEPPPEVGRESGVDVPAGPVSPAEVTPSDSPPPAATPAAAVPAPRKSSRRRRRS